MKKKLNMTHTTQLRVFIVNISTILLELTLIRDSLIRFKI